MLLLDLTHTAHTRSLTGIQRVTRALWTEFGAEALPICRDPYLRAWRPLESWETANLAVRTPSTKRSARWPLRSRLRGILGRLARRETALPGGVTALIEPEIFSPAVAVALPSLFARVPGPRVAVFYDAIALAYPELTPAGTVARFPSYLRELLEFDGVAAISRESRDSLLGYWQWLGARDTPPVVAIPHGPSGLAPATASGERPAPSSPTPAVLCVGTIEGRKNHIALLEACESLWARGLSFELRLIGLAQQRTGRVALSKIAELQGAGLPLRYDGPVDDAELERAYAACAFTVYPSLAEGFGLPVIESVARAKACICLGRGALGEAAEGGGCVALESVDAPALAGAMARLLTDPSEIARLEAEARARKFRSWTDYVRELAAWIGGLRVRRPVTST
jgi:glycosyltransferase involved in cell wall biosynthesis